MNYKWHTLINITMISTAAGFIYGQGIHPEIEVAAFWLLGIFHTVFVSPDIDHQNSQPTRNMGIMGKITSKVFTHRGILHNPIFWTVIYFAIGWYIRNTYSYEAWWMAGGLIALYLHIIIDKLSTGYKRKRTAIRRRVRHHHH